MFLNALPSEFIDVAGAIDPDAYSNAAVSSTYADMSLYECLLAVEMAGTMVSNATLNMKLQEAVAATGGSDITGKAITALTQAGGDSDKQALINLRRGELTEGYRYVKALRTLGTAGADEGCLLLGLKTPLVANAKASEVVAVLGTVDPDAYAPGAQSSDWIDMSKFHAALGIIALGDLGTDVTVVAKWEQATTSGGTPKDVTGRVTATLSASNTPTKLDLRADDLDAANNYRWARLTVTATDSSSPETAASDYAALVLGVWPRNGIASDQDLASVKEIVG